MLVEIYIEALLVDANEADRIWDSWNMGRLDDRQALHAWTRVYQRVDPVAPHSGIQPDFEGGAN